MEEPLPIDFWFWKDGYKVSCNLLVLFPDGYRIAYRPKMVKQFHMGRTATLMKTRSAQLGWGGLGWGFVV